MSDEWQQMPPMVDAGAGSSGKSLTAGSHLMEIAACESRSINWGGAMDLASMAAMRKKHRAELARPDQDIT